MIADTLMLIVAALPLMGSPGSATISLASLGAAFGFRACVPYLLGIMLATIAVLQIIATGITGVTAQRTGLLSALRLAAALYILYLAWTIATAPVGRSPTQEPGRSTVTVGAFLPGLGLAVANPKAFAAIGAVYAGYAITPDRLLLDTVLKVATLAGIAVVVNTAWLAFGSSFSRFLEHPTQGRVINIAFAIL